MALTLAMVTACGGEDGEPPLTVAAASSLAVAFERLAEDFSSEPGNPEVVLELAGSGTLREQILAGAPIDVYASANMSNMEQLVQAGMVSETPRAFARNRLVVAVPAGNPGGVAGLADLGRGELLVGVCAPTAPCGELAVAALEAAGVEAAADTEEPNVRALVTKLAAGELDVGVVYASDVAASEGAVVSVADLGVSAEYLIAVLSASPRQDSATAFVDHVTSARGQAVLAGLGFDPP